jgi:formamidopyrimidine-DNA glycosylase
MPELPEVETIVRMISPRLTGRKIDHIRLVRLDIVRPARTDLAKCLPGRGIGRIYRRAKRIVFELDDGNRFYIHLGMTGRLTLESPKSAIKAHTHLVLEMGQEELRFVDPRRFGGFFWLGSDDSWENDLGPEPLELSSEQLVVLLSQTKRAIKTALLDQKIIAGVGNIYADEALFAAKIHPRMAANRLTKEQIVRLNRGIKQVLTRALKHRGSTLRDYRDANGDSGNFQKLHRVYDRTGQPCWNCKTKIMRIVLGQRSTHFCPRCQMR